MSLIVIFIIGVSICAVYFWACYEAPVKSQHDNDRTTCESKSTDELGPLIYAKTNILTGEDTTEVWGYSKPCYFCKQAVCDDPWHLVVPVEYNGESIFVCKTCEENMIHSDDAPPKWVYIIHKKELPEKIKNIGMADNWNAIIEKKEYPYTQTLTQSFKDKASALEACESLNLDVRLTTTQTFRVFGGVLTIGSHMGKGCVEHYEKYWKGALDPDFDEIKFLDPRAQF